MHAKLGWFVGEQRSQWTREKAASYMSPEVGQVETGQLLFCFFNCELHFACSRLCEQNAPKLVQDHSLATLEVSLIMVIFL